VVPTGMFRHTPSRFTVASAFRDCFRAATAFPAFSSSDQPTKTFTSCSSCRFFPTATATTGCYLAAPHLHGDENYTCIDETGISVALSSTHQKHSHIRPVEFTFKDCLDHFDENREPHLAPPGESVVTQLSPPPVVSYFSQTCACHKLRPYHESHRATKLLDELGQRTLYLLFELIASELLQAVSSFFRCQPFCRCVHQSPAVYPLLKPHRHMSGLNPGNWQPLSAHQCKAVNPVL
jgi:hypothetical protein